MAAAPSYALSRPRFRLLTPDSKSRLDSAAAAAAERMILAQQLSLAGPTSPASGASASWVAELAR